MMKDRKKCVFYFYFFLISCLRVFFYTALENIHTKKCSMFVNMAGRSSNPRTAHTLGPYETIPASVQFSPSLVDIKGPPLSPRQGCERMANQFLTDTYLLLAKWSQSMFVWIPNCLDIHTLVPLWPPAQICDAPLITVSRYSCLHMVVFTNCTFRSCFMALGLWTTRNIWTN